MRPSMQPTGAPSRQPTSTPTARTQPSGQPTVQPSRRPTSRPSMQPSIQPTSRPSCQPSKQPSTRPSRVPSTQPSHQPASLPSVQPSEQPSHQPSRFPTSAPHVRPTSQPTRCPTMQPSRQPIIRPSSQPSMQPSRRPSRPSSQPSRQPTRQPTQQPSSQPSRRPSRKPSTQPTTQPTSQPSRQPTSQPSVLHKPTSQPSVQPLTRPSMQPTSQPSRRPSKCPSAQPTSQPSRQPSSRPKAYPTSQPSIQPSRQPTVRPQTASPTFAPSIAPTKSPTSKPSHTSTPTHTHSPTPSPTFAAVSLSVSQTISGVKIADTASFGATYVAAVQSSMPASATVTLTSCRGISQERDRQLSSRQRKPAVTLLGNTTIVYTGAIVAYSVTSGSTSLNATFLKAAISNGASAITATLANKSYPGASVAAPTMVNLSPTASPTIAIRAAIPRIKTMIVYPGSNNATVIVALQYSTSPLTVYCLALQQGSPSSVGLVRSTGAFNQFNPGSISNVTVFVTSLIASRSYNVYCYVQLSDGDGSSLTDVVNSAKAFNTICCSAVTFINAPVSVFGDVTLYTVKSPQSSYIFRVALESAPTNGNVTIVPRIRLANGQVPNQVTQAVNATPSSLTFRSTTPNQLTGQFYLYALKSVNGSYVIDLLIQGSARAQYIGGASTTIKASTTVVVLSSSQPLPAPRLLGAMFANSGGYIVISFDTATDQAGILDNTWSCARLFTFIGANLASCAWADLSTVRAYPAPVSNDPNTPNRAMQPGDTITLIGGKIRVQCRVDTVCTDNFVAATVTTSIQLPLNPLTPTVSVGVPNSVGGCSNLLVDLSSSTGNGGRVWQSITWNVASQRGDPSPVANYLLSYYDINSNTALVPKLLLLNTKYSITAKLTNFLNGSASGTSTVTVSGDINLPVVSIQGPSLINTKANTMLSLIGTAALTPCSQSNILKYTWTMKDPTSPTKTFTSTSIDPTKFQIGAYKLTAGLTYGVTLRVDVMKDSISNVVLSNATTAPTSVFVLSGDVIAGVRGGLSRQNPLDRSLTLDASFSYDENSLTTVLSYSWSCTVASTGSQFGQVCDFSALYVATVTTSVLVLPPNVMTYASTGLIYAFGVTAISPDGRMGNQVVAVTASASGAPVVSSNAKALTFNSDSKLNVYAYITASQAVVGTWTVNYASLPVSLSSALTSPVSTFTSDQVAGTVVFPISFPANTFVAGRTYSFTLSASPVFNRTIVASTQITLVCNSPPTGGYVLIAPSSGYALSTTFAMSASGWVDDPHNYPLAFAFSYARAASILIPPLTIKALSSLPYASSQLPEGLPSQNKSISIINLCCNQYLACANTSAPVTVAVNTTTNVLNLLTSSLGASLASGNADATFNAINLVSSTISTVNCTAVPPSFCATRNRFPCLEAGNPNECGSCLSGFTGTIGDGNLLCVNASVAIGRNGATCTKASDCLYSLCVDGSCAAPTKTCPTNVPGSPCSTYGSCKLTDLSGNVALACTVVDTTCTAVCQCESGHGGSDCSLGPKQLAARSLARTSMCEALTSVILTQDKSSHLLDVVVTALLSSYEVFNLRRPHILRCFPISFSHYALFTAFSR